MAEFHNTPMGHRFVNIVFPSLVNELTKLNQNLSKLIELFEKDRTINVRLVLDEKKENEK